MRIYYVANARMPTEKAHGIQIAKMCEALIEAGAEVELIVPTRGARDRTAKDFYHLRVEIPVTRIWTPDWYGRGRLGFWASSVFFMLGYWRYLRKKGHAGETEMVWAIDVDQFSFFFVPFIGMRYIAELHDAKPWTVPFFFLLRRALAVVVINNLIKEKLERRYGIDAACIRVHPNGIDVSDFSKGIARDEARRLLGLSQDEKVALYVGKFYRWKGLGILSRAGDLAEGVIFYLVGGSGEEYLQVTNNPRPLNMRCIGYTEHKKIPYWLAAADVLLVLGTAKVAYSYFYTSPMKLFEYMASRRPIVAADTPANRQIVSDAEAFFYKADDPADLAVQVRYALSHGEEASRRAEAAFQKVPQFTWEKRAESILKFLRI